MHPLNRISKAILRTYAIFALGLLGLLAVGTADSPVQGLIWKVSSDSMTIYLVGSIHFGAKQMYPLPKIFDTAFRQAADVVEELPPELPDSDFAALAQKYDILYGSGDDVFNHLSPTTGDRLRQFFKDNGWPVDRAQMLSPWLLSILVDNSALLKFAPGAQEPDVPGLEDYFTDLAKKAKKPIVGIESFEFQCKLFSSMAPADQEKSLTESLDNVDKSAKDTLQLVDDWIKGNAAAFDVTVQADRPPRAAVEDRNYHMADFAEGYLVHHKPCLFVVGAGHMMGKEGILQLLRNRGYKVQQILSN